MPMAPAAARAPSGLLSKSSFFVPSTNAATTARLGRRVGMNDRAVILGVAPRSRPRDGGWGADPDPFIGTGRMVDEDMATLRRRISEARAALSEDDSDDIDGDAGVSAPLPARCTKLEPRYYGSYVDGVRGAACLLEALLLNARPGLGVGALALLLLLLLGVPASAFLVCTKLIQAVDAISSAVNGR